jgi:hypothetical protein
MKRNFWPFAQNLAKSLTTSRSSTESPRRFEESGWRSTLFWDCHQQGHRWVDHDQRQKAAPNRSARHGQVCHREAEHQIGEANKPDVSENATLAGSTC